jgi:predicted O-methyltransferase YrrM
MRESVLSNKEEYLGALFNNENETKKLSRQFAEELGLARISISPAEAQLAHVLVKMHGCKKFVEIGTLTGLSAQYFFEALPAGGELRKKCYRNWIKPRKRFTWLSAMPAKNW